MQQVSDKKINENIFPYRDETLVVAENLDFVFSGICAHLQEHEIGTHHLNDVLYVETPELSATLKLSDENIDVKIAALDASILYFAKDWLENAITALCHRQISVQWAGDHESTDLLSCTHTLTVHKIIDITPRLRRITFHLSNAALFGRLDKMHLRILFNFREMMAASRRNSNDNEGVPAEIPKPLWRTYTVRSVNRAAGTIDIDFILHEESGPGADWARYVKIHDVVAASNPVGKPFCIAKSYFMMGDETALPVICRFLETLDETITVSLVAEVATRLDIVPIKSKATLKIKWLYRDEREEEQRHTLEDVVAIAEIPAFNEDRFVWVACEAGAARSIRSALLGRGVKNEEQSVYAYWRRA